MPYSVTFVPKITEGAQVVIPISLSNPSFNEESIPAILKVVTDSGAQVTVLIADHLSRHNMPEEDALAKGEAIINQYVNDFTHPAMTVVRWKNWIEQRQEQFDLSLKKTREVYDKGGAFKKAVLRTARQCKAAMSQESSVNYQLEEYAALGCKQEYDFLLYPALISHGMFGYYKAFDVEKPTYVHVRLKKYKPNKVPQSLFFTDDGSINGKKKKKTEYFSPYARSVFIQLEDFLNCPEVSMAEKNLLADKMNRLADLYLVKKNSEHSIKSMKLSEGSLSLIQINEKLSLAPGHS